MNIQKVPVESIHIGERQRTDIPKQHIEDLAQDIAQNGLIHAITLSKTSELCAGFCRLNAIKLLNEPYYYAGELIPAGFIPAAIVHYEHDKDLFRLELMENLRRKNLSPIDEARAIAALHRILVEKNSAENPGSHWSPAETGKEVDTMQGRERTTEAQRAVVGDSLLLDSFKDDPEINKAKTRGEAVKIAKKKLEIQLKQSLGALAGVGNANLDIIRGSCLEVLPTLETSSFAGIICDPPYGIDAETFGEASFNAGHEYADNWEYAENIIKTIIDEGYRVCKDDAHLYIFCDIRKFDRIRILADARGWQVFQTPLIWNKVNIGHTPWPGYFSRRYETILFAQKGSRALSKSRSDIFEYPAVRDKLHAAQKPVELLKEILATSFFAGERILDPCAGSGSIFVAAHSMEIDVTGIELSENFYHICKQRIGELK